MRTKRLGQDPCRTTILEVVGGVTMERLSGQMMEDEDTPSRIRPSHGDTPPIPESWEGQSIPALAIVSDERCI